MKCSRSCIRDAVGQSLPSRERGLKSTMASDGGIKTQVAPLAGAWIEIVKSHTSANVIIVAPLAGAWIEIATGRGKLMIRICRSPRGSVD